MKHRGIVSTLVTIMLIGASLTITADTNKQLLNITFGNRDTITLNPTDDTFVNQNYPNQIYGSHLMAKIRNRYGSTATWEADGLLKFPLSSIPSNALISSAELYLYYYEYLDTNPSGRPLTLYRITSNWNEDTTHWNNRPSYSTSLIDSTDVPSSYGWMSWDVASSVQDMVSGTIPNYGWQIMDETYWGGGNMPCTKLYTKENGANIPYLEIEYTTNNPPETPSTPSGPSEGIRDTEYEFSTSTTDIDGDLLFYLWDWDDGSPPVWYGPYSSGQTCTQTHEWTDIGTYEIKVKAKDSLNDESSWSLSHILEIENLQPIADAGGPYAGELNDNVNFDGSGSTDPDGTITAYEWDFGDGDTGSGSNPTHSYQNDGTFTVALTVTDNDGSTDTDSTTIEIIDSSVTVDAGGPYQGEVGESIQFTGSASEGAPPYTYNWDFGDGQTSTEQNPTHTYTIPGDHQIILSVVDSENNHGWDIADASITPAPLEVSANGPHSGKPGETISFQCTVTGGTPPYTYLWDFGDDTTSTAQNPDHVYDESKIYNIIVMVTDDEGVQKTDTTTASISSTIPDLACAGTINLGLVQPGDILTTGFSLMNNGDFGSLLDWGIKSYPEWGSDWSYAVEEGQETDLTPEAGMIWVEISLTVPDTQSRIIEFFKNSDDTEYTGEIIVENLEDSSDICEIPIQMTVPKYRFCNPLQLLLQWIGNSFPFLRLNS